MDRSQFWKIIDASRQEPGGDLDAQVEALREQLQALPPEQVVQFQEFFDEYHARAYRWDLWGAAYILGGGCSDDGFLDFRAWLISKGERAYEDALQDPDGLVRVVKE